MSDIPVSELIEYWSNQPYTVMGQATLDALERLRTAQPKPFLVDDKTFLANVNAMYPHVPQGAPLWIGVRRYVFHNGGFVESDLGDWCDYNEMLQFVRAIQSAPSAQLKVDSGVTIEQCIAGLRKIRPAIGNEYPDSPVWTGAAEIIDDAIDKLSRCAPSPSAVATSSGEGEHAYNCLCSCSACTKAREPISPPAKASGAFEGVTDEREAIAFEEAITALEDKAKDLFTTGTEPRHRNYARQLRKYAKLLSARLTRGYAAERQWVKWKQGDAMPPHGRYLCHAWTPLNVEVERVFESGRVDWRGSGDYHIDAYLPDPLPAPYVSAESEGA